MKSVPEATSTVKKLGGSLPPQPCNGGENSLGQKVDELVKGQVLQSAEMANLTKAVELLANRIDDRSRAQMDLAAQGVQKASPSLATARRDAPPKEFKTLLEAHETLLGTQNAEIRRLNDDMRKLREERESTEEEISKLQTDKLHAEQQLRLAQESLSSLPVNSNRVETAPGEGAVAPVKRFFRKSGCLLKKNWRPIVSTSVMGAGGIMAFFFMEFAVPIILIVGAIVAITQLRK